MPFEKTEKIWMDGELVPWDEARIHVLTHSLHYGSGVFEGIRTYAAADGPAVFRLTDHIQRLFDSAKLIMMEIPYARDEIVEACKLIVRESGLDSCYVRPIAFLGYGEIGLNPLPCDGERRRSRRGRGAPTSARRASRPACGCRCRRGGAWTPTSTRSRPRAPASTSTRAWPRSRR